MSSPYPLPLSFHGGCGVIVSIPPGPGITAELLLTPFPPPITTTEGTLLRRLEAGLWGYLLSFNMFTHPLGDAQWLLTLKYLQNFCQNHINQTQSILRNNSDH